MNWLLIAAFALAGCTIEVKPLKDTKGKHYTHHTGKARKPKVIPSPTPEPSPDLSRLAPILREQ
jgi:hypothetical protein